MILLLFVATAAALPTPKFLPTPLQWSPSSEAVCAPSGLRLTVERDLTARQVVLVSIVDAGRADEPEGQAGIAHLAEHLWFRRRAVEHGTVAETLNLLGVYNAFTETDVTEFVSEFPPDQLDRALAVEGLRFRSPLDGVDLTVFEAEREVVAREAATHLHRTFGGALAQLDARLFPSGHPYARSSPARADVVRALTLAQVAAFMAAHYTPANTTLHLAGAVPEGDLEPRLTRAFPSEALMAPGGVAQTCAAFGGEAGPPPTPKNDAVDQVAAGVTRPLDLVAWSVPGGWTDSAGVEDEADDLLATALSMVCTRTTMRLASRVVCHGVHQGKDPAAPPDLAGLASLHTRATAAAYKESWKESGPITRQRYFFAAEAWLRPFSSEALLPFRANHALRAGAWYPTQLARLASADPKEPFTYAHQWFTPERAVRLVLRPGASTMDEPSLDHPEVPVLDAGIEVDPARLAARLPDLSDAILRERLESGASVVVLPNGAFPSVAVEMIFAGGPDREPAFGLQDVLRHQERWTPRNIGFSLTGALFTAGVLGIRLDGAEAHTFRWVGPSAALPEILWTLRHRLFATELVDGGVDAAEVLATKAIPALQVPSDAALQLAMERLFGPGVEPTQHDWKVAQNLSFGKRQSFVNGIRQPELATLNIVGGVDPTVALAAAHAAFDTWPVPKATVPPLNGRHLDARSVAAEGGFVALGATNVANVALVCPIADAGPAMGAALQAGAYARLFAAARDATALAYDPWADVVRRPDTGAVLQLGATVAPQNAGEAIHVLRGVVRRFATETDDTEARRMALTAALRLDVNRSSNTGLLNGLGFAALDLEPETWFYREREGLLTLTGDRVRAQMEGCLAKLSWAAAGHPQSFHAIAEQGLAVKELTAREWVGAHVELPEGQ